MIVPMTKVQVIGAKTDFFEAVALLHDLGALHLEDANRTGLGPDVAAPEPLYDRMKLAPEGEEKRRRLDEVLIRLNAVLSGLQEPGTAEAEAKRADLYRKHVKKDFEGLVTEAGDLLAGAEEPARALANRRSAATKELAQADKYEAILSQFYPLLQKFAPVEGFDTVALLLERRFRTLLDLIEEELSAITGGKSMLEATDVGEDTTAVIVMFANEYAEQVRRLLWEEKVNEVRLPESIADKPFEQAMNELNIRKNRIPYEIEEIDAEIGKLSVAWWAKIRALRDAVLDQLDQIKGVSRFGETEYTFVVRGWVPTKEIPRVKKDLEARFAGRTMIEELTFEEWEIDHVPVALKNGKFFRPYEFLLSFFQLPRYGTIDPSVLLGVFFLIFFGLIVGDVGYGIIIIALALFMRRKFRASAAGVLASGIFIWAGISAIIFGILFGEFIGDLPHRLHWIEPIPLGGGYEFPLERTELIMPLLIFTAAIGALHLLLGLVMGTVVTLKHHAYRHAAEKIGFILILGAVTVFILKAVYAWPSVATLGAWLLFIGGTAALVYSGGPGIVKGLLGLLLHYVDLIRNVASYTRLMALGLAGAFLGLVANELGSITGSLVLGLIVALVLHTLNLVISVFSPTLHSLRLNFLEFFSTFYEAGGRPYQPFKRSG